VSYDLFLCYHFFDVNNDLLTSFLDRRLARRGGVGRISGQIYEDARTAMVYQLKRVSRELTRGFVIVRLDAKRCQFHVIGSERLRDIRRTLQQEKCVLLGFSIFIHDCKEYLTNGSHHSAVTVSDVSISVAIFLQGGD
jgi:hypothetical protein